MREPCTGPEQRSQCLRLASVSNYGLINDNDHNNSSYGSRASLWNLLTHIACRHEWWIGLERTPLAGLGVCVCVILHCELPSNVFALINRVFCGNCVGMYRERAMTNCREFKVMFERAALPSLTQVPLNRKHSLRNMRTNSRALQPRCVCSSRF